MVFSARVALLAVVVGLAVATLGRQSGAADCASGAASGGTTITADPVCLQLVRTFAVRTGVLAAVATVMIVLSAVGLYQSVAPGPERPL